MTGKTIIEVLRDSLTAAGRYNPDDMAKPAAIIWTDSDRQWQPVISQLQLLMPELFILRAYQPEKKIGPAIWLRCIIDRALPGIELPDDRVPVLYMPGVSRQTLRAVHECPDGLKPLVELQYRGVCWTQKNGKDWTVEAFVVSKDGGLGLWPRMRPHGLPLLLLCRSLLPNQSPSFWAKIWRQKILRNSLSKTRSRICLSG